MTRNLLVGMAAVLGVVTYAAPVQAQGPQFAQAHAVSTYVLPGANPYALYYNDGVQPYIYGRLIDGMVTTHAWSKTPLTVKVVNSGPTFQQVFLTGKGVIYTATLTSTGLVQGPNIPVSFQAFVTITAQKKATMTIKAFNATGQVFAVGPLTGVWQ